MKVVLTENVMENGQIKTTVLMGKKQVIGWFEGVVLDVSEGTGRKLIDAKQAKAQTEQQLTSAPAAAKEQK